MDKETGTVHVSTMYMSKVCNINIIFEHAEQQLFSVTPMLIRASDVVTVFVQ